MRFLATVHKVDMNPYVKVAAASVEVRTTAGGSSPSKGLSH
jgi:hypothetical protein